MSDFAPAWGHNGAGGEGGPSWQPVEAWENEEEREKGDMWCGSAWEGIRWREKKKKRKNTLWTFYPFQQLEKVILPNFFSNQ